MIPPVVTSTIAGEAGNSEFRTVRVAAISFVPTKFDLQGNASRLKAAFRLAKQGGAEIAVGPEGALEGYVVNEIIAGQVDEKKMNDVAVPISHPVIRQFQKLARELDMCLVFGLAERIENEVFNCAVFIDHSGNISGKYHKMQFAEGYHSSWWFNRLGRKSRAFDTPFGRCGMLICNDRWNPKLAKIPVLDGAQFLIIPAMGSRSKSQDEAVLNRGRENSVPVIEANVGVTLIVNNGQITAVDRKEEAVTFGEITIASAGNRCPAARDRVEQEFVKLRKDDMQRRLRRRQMTDRENARAESNNRFLSSRTQAIAFAGGPGPENTMAAIKQSLELDVPLLEFDVRLTKDRVAVLMHDDDVSRTTNGTGSIADLAFADVRKLDAGLNYVDPKTGARRFEGERVPVLTEVLDVIIDKDKTVLLDVKVPEDARTVIEVVSQAQAFDRVVFRVGNDTEIERLRQIDPRIQCVLRVSLSEHDLSQMFVHLKQLRVVACTPEPWQQLTPTIVSRFHHAGIAVWVAGADRPENVDRMIDAGVDGVFTTSTCELRRIIGDTNGQISDRP